MERPTSRREQAGFTVMEMMCAAVVMGLLVATVSSSVGDFTIKAKLASTKMNCRVVQNIVVGYTTDHHGDVPTSRAQYVSSPTYQSLSNPFNVTQKGIGKWNNDEGNSADDNTSSQAPVAIWNIDPAMITLTNTAGVVFYVPYKKASDLQTTTGVNIGGDNGSNGYSGYVIQAMGMINQQTPQAIPYSDSRIST